MERAGRRGGGWGRTLGPACLLILALLLTHQALMASERHATVMGPLLGSTTPTPLMNHVTQPASATLAGHPAPAPPPFLSECPAQVAIPPLLALLLTLIVVIRRPAATPGAPGLHRLARPLFAWRAPPLLASTRRRALLQVFLI